jgi:hypothetical protein
MRGAPAIDEVTPKADATDALAVTDGSVHVGTIAERHGKHFASQSLPPHKRVERVVDQFLVAGGAEGE